MGCEGFGIAGLTGPSRLPTLLDLAYIGVMPTLTRRTTRQELDAPSPDRDDAGNPLAADPIDLPGEPSQSHEADWAESRRRYANMTGEGREKLLRLFGDVDPASAKKLLDALAVREGRNRA
jgi:hypothetical protein